MEEERERDEAEERGRKEEEERERKWREEYTKRGDATHTRDLLDLQSNDQSPRVPDSLPATNLTSGTNQVPTASRSEAATLFSLLETVKAIKVPTNFRLDYTE